MESRFVRRSLPQAVLGKGSLALLDATKGKYFGLGGTAFRIWELLEHPITLPDLCDRLLSDFDVAPKQCREQVEEFIAQLIKEGLVSEVHVR